MYQNVLDLNLISLTVDLILVLELLLIDVFGSAAIISYPLFCFQTMVVFFPNVSNIYMYMYIFFYHHASLKETSNKMCCVFKSFLTTFVH